MSLAITAAELAWDPVAGLARYKQARTAMRTIPAKPIEETPEQVSGRSFSYAPAFFPPGGTWFKDEKFAIEVQNIKCRKTAREICEEICEKHNITFIDLISPRRPNYIVTARREAVYRMRNETVCSFPMIGRILNRDHSTCVHSYQRYVELMEVEKCQGAPGDLVPDLTRRKLLSHGSYSGNGRPTRTR